MRNLIYLFVLFVPLFCLASQEKDIQQILKGMDAVVANNESYILKKEARLEVLYNRKQVLQPQSEYLYDLNYQLYEEYKAYICDSAIAYLNENINIARHLRDNERLVDSKLLLASLLESSGLYKEASDLIDSIDRSTLPNRFIVKYYNTYYRVYRALEHYTPDQRLGAIYRDKMRTYRDSLYQVTDREATDEESRIIWETYHREKNNYEEARRINDLRLEAVKPGTPAHAMVTYYRSLIEDDQGNAEMRKYNLALSALSDLQAAIKDHASLWMLAEILYEEGDIDRAYNYIRYSWKDTQFYNARHRSLQTAGILSLIDQTYQKKIADKNDRLRNFIAIISILVFLLAIALFFIYRQIKKLSVARNELQKANSQLKELNEELKLTNNNIQVSNDNLSESNMIKEKYIGRFINLCSVYIDKLDAYRRMVYKKINLGQIDQLKQITGSAESLDEELKELLNNFDIAFLQLFPDFVEKFNGLLMDEEVITLKKGELLNTELRIYALIRLGIDDSARIAEFLRYSLNTIYNYRAKVRNKAKVSRDDFETLVKQIK